MENELSLENNKSIEFFFEDEYDKNKLISGVTENNSETILFTNEARFRFNYLKNSTLMHYHNYYEIEIVISGEICEYDGKIVHNLKSNDVIIVSPTENHSYIKQDTNTDTAIILNIALKKEYLKTVLKYLPEYHFPQYFSLEQHEVDLIIQSLMFAYNTVLVSNRDYLRLLKKNAVNFIVSLLFSKILNNNDSDDNNGIIAAIAYIDNNFNEKITCANVAEKFGYTPNYFSSKFKKLTGVPFAKYILNLRLEMAMKLLAIDEMSLTDIAISCNFNTPSYFSACFKNKYGITPTEYRNILNNDN